MKNNEQMDIGAMTATIPMFSEIDNLADEFYEEVPEYNNASIQDIKYLFIKTLKNIITLVEDSSYTKEDQKTLISRLVIDFHVTYAEKNKLDVYILSQSLGEWSITILKESVDYFKN